MSRDERYGTRDLSFSRWHRLIPDDNLKWIDLDYVGFCHRCFEPIGLLELARDVGQSAKSFTVTRKVALRLGVPAARVFYRVDESGEPVSFRVKRIAPDVRDEVAVSPAEFVAMLKALRVRHVCEAMEQEREAA